MSVRILDHDYRIRTEADETTVEQVARVVSERMERIRTRTGTVDTLDLAVLAALNLANDLVSERGETDWQSSRSGQARLQALIDDVESTLREAGVAP